MHLPAMSIFDDNSFIPAASVSEFCCVDPQQWRLAPVQPFWQLPYLPFDAPLGQMMADYVPPVDPEILVRFMLSPDYSLLKSSEVVRSANCLGHSKNGQEHFVILS